MRIFSYRNKRALRRGGLIALAVLLLLAVLILCRVIYLERYVTYTADGAKLDYTQKLTRTDVDPQKPNPDDYPFEMILESSTVQEESGTTLAQFQGVYITTTMMAQHLDEVLTAVDSLDPDITAVMIDAKSIFGFYYYSSELTGAETADSDIAAIDALIEKLTQKEGLRVIARVPAFCDPEYALKHQDDALPLYTGALWTDENNCYWLNPYKNDVQGYLVSIAIELSKRGFDEILFDDFYFPSSDRIAWNSDISREDAVLDAALNVSDSLYGYNIAVSFGSKSPAVAKYASRIYVTTDDPTQVMELTDAMQGTLADMASQIVFLTASRDTRFEQCSVLRPLLDS